MTTTPPYRPDIDGLRALAVLPVLFFHIGVPGFSGGYVGVDIFFVISGYLITGILYRDILTGRHSILMFYERRIRRIIPALSVVLIFVLAVSPFALLPSEYRVLPREVLGALFFVANIVFWREAGYFGAAAEQKPLLHTWSLGVEEQFYIFAPLILLLVLRHMYRWRIGVIAGIALFSFALSVGLTPAKSAAAFYLLPTRAWELLLGSIFALASLPGLSGPVRRTIASTVGLALLAGSVFFLDETTPFPGYAAAMPALAAGILIATAQGTWIGVLLGWRPLVRIGLLSYSLYLWHWPLTVFARDWGLLDNGLGKLAVALISLLLAWLSWKFVEMPSRMRARVPLPQLLRWTGATTALIVGLSVATAATNGWPSRFSTQAQAYDRARDDISPSRATCHIGSGLGTSDAFCRLGGELPRVALWGDSHGVEISQGIANAGVPVMAITYSSCSPGLGLRYDDRPMCDEHNAYVMDFLSNSPSIGTVILAARYPEGNNAVPSAIAASAAGLLDAGKRVIVIGPVPTPGFDVPSHLAAGGAPAFAWSGPERDAFAAWFPPGVDVFMPSDRFCVRGVCTMTPQDHALLFDSHHLSMSAANILARDLVSMMQTARQVSARSRQSTSNP